MCDAVGGGRDGSAPALSLQPSQTGRPPPWSSRLLTPPEQGLPVSGCVGPRGHAGVRGVCGGTRGQSFPGSVSHGGNKRLKCSCCDLPPVTRVDLWDRHTDSGLLAGDHLPEMAGPSGCGPSPGNRWAFWAPAACIPAGLLSWLGSATSSISLLLLLLLVLNLPGRVPQLTLSLLSLLSLLPQPGAEKRGPQRAHLAGRAGEAPLP